MRNQNTNSLTHSSSADMVPTQAEADRYGIFKLVKADLLSKPSDVSASEIAYNPSGITRVGDHNILFVRKEPDRSNASSSHLGNSVARPYIIDIKNPLAPLTPYYDADEIRGEDPALTRVKRKLPSGKTEVFFVFSVVDPKPKSDKPNEVQTLRTRFYAGKTLKNMEHIADGPEWMKDIRISQKRGDESFAIDVYGRPQPLPDSGNITYIKLPSLDALNSESIASAPFIDENLFPVGSGIWGGVNDVLPISPYENVLLVHKAWRTGVDGNSRHYEAARYGHDTETNRVVYLGGIATADMFPQGTVKADDSVNLGDVCFPGGAYNGRQDCVTVGVGDGNIGLAYLRRVRASV